MWRVQRGSTIQGRYRVVQECGRGSFARVLRCEDIQTGKPCALKVLEREYGRDAQRETEVLKAVNRKDPNNKEAVVKMLGYFQWEGLHCMTFALHGSSLRNRRFGQRDKAGVAQLARQIGSALAFLHVSCRVVHTDLKPENILLEREEGSHGLGTRFVVCDLGSASFYTERADSELITTRPYRAPEVLLCSGWSWGADNFSLGCILYEVYTGQTLFECARYSDNDEQHIQAMTSRLGQLPTWLAESAVGRGRGLVHQLTGRGRWTPSPFSAADRSVAANFSDKISDPELTDFIGRLLDYDTHQRLRGDEVAHHPFVTSHLGRPASSLVSRYPPSAYSAGRIASAGRSLPRTPVDQLRKSQAAAPAPRSSSARPGMKGRELQALRDVTNRVGDMPLTARGKPTSAAEIPRGRSGSLYGNSGNFQRPTSRLW